MLVRISVLTIEKLVELGIGDTGRLYHIKKTVEQGKDLYASDKAYLDSLVGYFLSKNTDELHRPVQYDVVSVSKTKRGKRVLSVFSKSLYFLYLFFKTGFAQKTSNLALTLGRLGLGLAFMYQGYVNFNAPMELGTLLSAVTGWSSATAYNTIFAIGVIEGIGGVLVLLGFLTRLDTLAFSVVLVGEIVLFSQLLDASYYDLIWKDVGLLGLALVLMMAGSGKWSIDYFLSHILAKRKQLPALE